MADPPAKKEPTTFLSLPGELRNYIYELSGCLKILQCRNCHGTVRGDDQQTFRRPCCFYMYERIKIYCEYREKSYLWVDRKSHKCDNDCRRFMLSKPASLD